MGRKESKHITIKAISQNNLSKKKGRVEYKRGYLKQENNNNVVMSMDYRDQIYLPSWRKLIAT